MNELSTLQSLSLQNRSSYCLKQIQSQKKTDARVESSTKILSYAPESGHYRCQDTSGRIYLARAISNSSALSRAAIVNLVNPGGIPVIDAMPR